MTVMAIDMLAPEYGKHTLKEYFIKLKTQMHNNRLHTDRKKLRIFPALHFDPGEAGY